MDVVNRRNLERSARPTGTGTGNQRADRSCGTLRPALCLYAPAMIALALLTVALGATSTPARTLAVPESYPTLKAALDAASRGDIILVGCGTYHEHDLQVKPGVSLWSGTLQPDCVIIDADGRGRIFLFTDCDSTTSVVGFTLRNGRSDADGGAILCRDSSVRLSRLHILDSRARRGGGLASLGRGGPHLIDCEIKGNEADLHGGGLYWDISGGGSIERSTIERNQALAGGGLACREADRLLITSVTFQGNEAASSGGAVWLGGGAPGFDQCLHGGRQHRRDHRRRPARGSRLRPDPPHHPRLQRPRRPGQRTVQPATPERHQHLRPSRWRLGRTAGRATGSRAEFLPGPWFLLAGERALRFAGRVALLAGGQWWGACGSSVPRVWALR